MPPAAQIGNGHDDAHESRIQRVESDLSDLKTQHAEMNITLKYLGTQLTESTARVVDKIEACVAPLSTKLQETAAHLDNVTNKVAEQAHFMDMHEKEKQSKTQRWESWKKAILTVVTGAGAIGLKELIMVLFFKH